MFYLRYPDTYEILAVFVVPIYAFISILVLMMLWMVNITRRNINANNNNGNRDVPMIAASFFLTLGFPIVGSFAYLFAYLISLIIWEFDIFPNFPGLLFSAIYVGCSLAVLTILWICNVRRRNNGHVHTHANSHDMKFPADSYSFVAFYSLDTNADAFCLGIFVFLFQSGFFILMILSVVHQPWRTTGEVDNPDSESGFWARFIPSNAAGIVKVTQILAILSSLVFPEASLLDISTAIQMFPQLCKNNQNEKVWGVAFSCILRSIQGLLAVIAVFLLVMTSSDVTEIVLNFTAVNFISLLDDAAFKLAMGGKYGPVMEEAAERVVEEPVPRCMISKTSHGYRIAFFVISVFLFGMMGFVFVSQASNEKWLTNRIDVRFGRSDAVESYSGCYEINMGTNLNNRYEYKLFDVDQDTKTYIDYCKEDRRWVIYRKIWSSAGPCDARKSNEDMELAHSAKTDVFDIETAFEEAWYSASNEPLEVAVFELRENQTRCFSGCKDDFLVYGNYMCWNKGLFF